MLDCAIFASQVESLCRRRHWSADAVEQLADLLGCFLQEEMAVRVLVEEVADPSPVLGAQEEVREHPGSAGAKAVSGWARCGGGKPLRRC
jgi:hypothetical protein